jgi:hypothetical protein
MDRALLDGALDRVPVNDEGRSGAALERVVLAEGARVVVKRLDPALDLIMRLSGDPLGREVELARREVLGALPSTVLHAVIDGWYDEDGRGVLVMRDSEAPYSRGSPSSAATRPGRCSLQWLTCTRRSWAPRRTG